MTPSAEQIRRALVAFQQRFKLARSRAYRRVFAREGGRFDRSAEIVLADLRDYCRANAAAWDRDARISDRLAGRRDVWLRISEHLNLTDDEILKLVEVESE